MTLVDAGWRTAAVYLACAQAGLGVMPIMGFGKSAGCTQASFSDVQRRTLDKKPGDRWFLSRKGRLWLVCADTDHWRVVGTYQRNGKRPATCVPQLQADDSHGMKFPSHPATN